MTLGPLCLADIPEIRREHGGAFFRVPGDRQFCRELRAVNICGNDAIPDTM